MQEGSMARTARRKQRSGRKVSKSAKTSLPFTKHNYILFFAGIALLLVGYIFMSIGPVDSFESLTLAPILLVIGYLVIIPLSFLYKHKSLERTADKPEIHEKAADSSQSS